MLPHRKGHTLPRAMGCGRNRKIRNPALKGCIAIYFYHSMNGSILPFLLFFLCCFYFFWCLVHLSELSLFTDKMLGQQRRNKLVCLYEPCCP